jgi:hypothetical protein
MEFDDYQEKAVLTGQFPNKKSDGALMIPLLGIAGEIVAFVYANARERRYYKACYF